MGKVLFEGVAPYPMPAFHYGEAVGQRLNVTAYLYFSIDGRKQAIEIQMPQPQALEFATRLAKAATDTLI